MAKQTALKEGVPWVEKYRPKNLGDVSHQEEAMLMLKNVVKTGRMPHLLFHGPPGTGKTSSILALAAELFGKEHKADRVKELNASDDRGISAVREKIKEWSRYEPRGGTKANTNKALPPWKIVILDEADMMTTDAQSALRRVIEECSRSTRFVIICNYFHKIIEPLASRCSVYRFQSISKEPQIARLKYICESENVKYADEEVLNAIYEVSEGDLRRSITLLQSTSCFYDVLDVETIYEVAGHPPSSIAEELLEACRTSRALTEQKIREIYEEGWATCVITRQLASLVIAGKDTNIQKARICLLIAERDSAVQQDASAFLNMLAIGNSICMTLRTR